MDVMRRSPRKESLFAVLLVALLHLPLAYVLLQGPRGPMAKAAREPGIAVVFLPRVVPPTPSTATAAAPSPVLPVAVRKTVVTSARPSPSADPDGTAPTPPAATKGPPGLDLRLPDAYRAQVDSAPRKVGDTRNPVDFQATRFNPQWAPDGGEMQQAWAFHSRTARMLLSMTGALVKPCTEAERKRRERRCAGAQYDGE